jgi:hypothetical protein
MKTNNAEMMTTAGCLAITIIGWQHPLEWVKSKTWVKYIVSRLYLR